MLKNFNLVFICIVLTLSGSNRALSSPIETKEEKETPKQLYTQDQEDRKKWPNLDWKTVTEKDRKRRTDASIIIKDNYVLTRDDYYYLSFIFQHGDTADDFLLAHILAVSALSMSAEKTSFSNEDISSIAAAAMDRFLQKIGRPQVYGTQSTTLDGAPLTQEPFNRHFINDRIRIISGSGSLKEQKENLSTVQKLLDSKGNKVEKN